MKKLTLIFLLAFAPLCLFAAADGGDGNKEGTKKEGAKKEGAKKEGSGVAKKAAGTASKLRGAARGAGKK